MEKDELELEKQNLEWFPSYLSRCKQLIKYCDFGTKLLELKCGVSQVPNLSPLVFQIARLIFKKSLTLTKRNKNESFFKVNCELDKISFGCKTNYLSLNDEKQCV